MVCALTAAWRAWREEMCRCASGETEPSLSAIYFRREVDDGLCGVRVSMTRQTRHSRLVSAFCPVRPQHPMWSGDGFGAPDTILGRVG
jgi:hypothetical protein